MIHLPYGGIPLYLITLVILISLQNGADCLIIGFVGGFIYDLNPSITSPMGEWALIFTIVGALYMNYKPVLVDILDRPILALFIYSFTLIVVLSIFEIFSAIFGGNLGAVHNLFSTLLATIIWTFLIAPILLPSLRKFSELLLSSQERR